MERGICININNEDETIVVVMNTEKGSEIKFPNYHRLRKWDVITKKLDNELGSHTIVGEDKDTHSFKTFTYENGIRVHTEPYEFLINLPNMDRLADMKTLIQSVGYKIRRVDDLYDRLLVEAPF